MSTEQLRFTLSLDTSGVDTGAAKASKSLRDVEKAASQVGTTTAKAGTEASTGLGKTATAAGSAEKSVTKAGTAAQKAGREAAKGGEEAAKSWGKFSEAAQSADWGKVTGGLAAVGVAMALPVGAAVKEFATFDQAMSGVASTGDDARASIDQLREAAMAAGADTAFSATEAANAVEELTRAGVSAADTLDGGLAGSLDLAAAGTIEVADAAAIASTAMTQFKLSGADIPHVADLLAAGAGKAMGGVDDLGMALKQSGLVASQFGLSIEETVGGLSAFASAGLLGSDAGTSLKTMLLALANPSGEAAKLMQELGINAYDAQGQFVGLEGLAGQLKAGMEGLTDAQRQQALATIFGTDAIRPASILYEQGAEGIRTWTEAVNDSGYAARTAAELQNNLIGDLEKLGGSWSTLAITMGEAADGPLRGAAQGLTSLLDAAAESPAAAQAIFGVTAGLAGLTLGAAALMKGVTFVSEFRGAVAALSDTYPGVERLSGGLGKVAKAAGAAALVITVIQAAKAIGDTFHEAAAEAEAAATAITLAYTSTADSAATAAERVSALDTVFQRADGSAYLDRIGQKVDSLDTALARYADRGWKYADGIDAAFAGLAGSETVIAGLTNQFGLLDQELSTLTVAQSTDVFAGIAEKAAAAGMSVEDLITLFPTYAAQMQQLAAANGLGELSATDLAAAMSGTYEPLVAAQQAMGDTTTAAAAQEGAYDAAAASAEELAAAQKEAADQARAAVDAFTAELDAIQALNDAQTGAANTQMAAERAADEYRDTLDKISETLRKNGNSFDENSEKGRANREALRDLASSARSTTDAMLANGDSVDTVNAKMAQQRADFIETATAAGIPKKAAKDLADAYGLIPNYVETTVATPGAKMSKREADDLNRALEGLPDDVKTSIITLANTRGVDVAKAALASVKDKTVTVRISTIGGGATRQRAVATGDIFEYYAAGGFSSAGDYANAHQPTILPAGTNRLFAEPETGGEAYIPLANDWRRPRALSIWAETGRRLGAELAAGYAAGGIAAFAAGGTLQSAGYGARSSTVAAIDINVVGIFPVQEINELAIAVRKASSGLGPLEKSAKAATKASEAATAERKTAEAELKALRKSEVATKGQVAAAEKRVESAKTAAAKATEKAKTATEKLTEASKDRTEAEKKLQAALESVSSSARSTAESFAKGYMTYGSTASAVSDLGAAARSAADSFAASLLKPEENASADSWSAAMREGAADMVAFNSQIKQLRELGLSEQLVQEVVSRGVEAGSALAHDIILRSRDWQDQATQDSGVKALNEAAAAVAAAAAQMSGGTNKTGADAWAASMKTGAKELDAFTAQIVELRNLGLNESLVQQIIDWGQDAGGKVAADIIAQGRPGAEALNKAGDRLQKASEKLGLSAAIGELKLVDAGNSLTRAADRLITAASQMGGAAAAISSGSTPSPKKKLADGGIEDHTAHIATTMRIFAEPETGGEAYIPLAASKRARSLSIWAETGRRLGVAGFANGGLRPAPARAIAAVPTLSGDVLEAVVMRLAQVLRERPTTSLTVVNPLVRDSMREARLAREELEVML